MMVTSSKRGWKRSAVQSSNSDAISALPSNITGHILERMPLRDAVRTSVLSSAWRHKWAAISQLVFDREFLWKSLGNDQLKAIIYQVLLLHSEPLVRFELSIPQLNSCIDINHWILILLKKNIQELTLLFPPLPLPNHQLPVHLFSFLHLTHLHLQHCEFAPPPTSNGLFSRLVYLHLDNVRLVPETLGRFVFNCTLLERLTLCRCTGFDCLEINFPHLVHFYFRGISKSICFRNTNLLAEISVILDTNTEQHEGEEDSNLLKFFSYLPAVKTLSLNTCTLQLLSVGGVPKSLPNPLNCLQSIYLAVHFNKIDQVTCILCLFRSSPNLRKIRIRSCTGKEEDLEVVDYWQAPPDFSMFQLNRFCEVDMLDLSGVKPELLFLKFLLACSTELEKVRIWPVKEKASSIEGFEILKELIRYPRASPKAELIFHDFIHPL